MPHCNDPKQTFLNRRDWNSYLTKLHSAASYPKVMEALKSSRAWLTTEASGASVWLVGSAELGRKFAP